MWYQIIVRNIVLPNVRISFSRQTAKPQHRTIVKHATVHHKVTPATVKFQKKTKVVHPVHKHPQWLSQATKTRKVSSSSKVSKSKTSRTSKTATKSKATTSKTSKSKVTKAKPVKPSVKTSVRTATKTTHSQPKRITTISHPNVGHPIYQVVTTCDFGQTTKESGLDDAFKNHEEVWQ